MDCETNDCRKEKRGCEGCYYENRVVANTDRTYCYGLNCKECFSCSRFVAFYEFQKNRNYSFIYNCKNRLFEKKENK